MVENKNTYGAEIEKTVTGKNGLPQAVSQAFFERLKKSAESRGKFDHLHLSDVKPEITLGAVSTDIGEQGVDNGFILLESALNYQPSLEELQRLMKVDLETVQTALEIEGASVVNLSIHPLGQRDYQTYKSLVAPKGIYPYIWYRGWDHTAGADGRAQNSPTTGVQPHEAADAVSVVIGAGAAFIGLFANSPYEEGQRGPKESRSTMWERMMRNAKVEGDRLTAQFPPDRFNTLAQYFNWMFGGQTGIHFVLADNPSGNSDYKGIGDRVLIVQGNPSVLEYLSKKEWQAFYLKELMNGFPPEHVISVKPDISHMEVMQFAQFAGARVRYELDHTGFPIREFLEACSNPSENKVEDIFSSCAKFMYIEGRDPGANFPDRELGNRDNEVADTVIISPAAIQAGLIRNLGEATQFIDGFQWEHLRELRKAAIQDGLQGEVDGYSVHRFAGKVIEIAARGLTSSEQIMLRYPEFVLQEGKNGADRAIEFVEKLGKPLPIAISDLVRSRMIIADQL